MPLVNPAPISEEKQCLKRRERLRQRGGSVRGAARVGGIMATSCLITGATGFVGGHLVQACAGRGWNVRALVRPGSDTSLLEKHNVALVRGELSDAGAVREALHGVEVVLHCAAKVGDWGPVEEYRAVNVEALRGLLEACREQPLRRFVHFSSLGVYAARHHHGTDESEPLPERHMDGYTQTKVESERLALLYYHEHKLPVVVLRPGFIYGPRDRTLMPKMLENLRLRRVRYIGGGRGALNCIYVGNLVEAALLAAEKPEAVGQIYNLTDGEFISKRRFIESIVSGMGLPHPKPVGLPLWLARIVASYLENRARRRGKPTAPRLTQGRLKLFGLNLDFSIEKAKRELGYRPRWSFDEGMRETVAYYKQNA